jgi:hypothetical protein
VASIHTTWFNSKYHCTMTTQCIHRVHIILTISINKLIFVKEMCLHYKAFCLFWHTADRDEDDDDDELHAFIDVSNDPEVRKSPYGWKSMHRTVVLCPVNVRTIFAASKSQILSAPVCDPAHTSSSVCPNCTHSTAVVWPLRLWTKKQ